MNGFSYKLKQCMLLATGQITGVVLLYMFNIFNIELVLVSLLGISVGFNLVFYGCLKERKNDMETTELDRSEK